MAQRRSAVSKSDSESSKIIVEPVDITKVVKPLTLDCAPAHDEEDVPLVSDDKDELNHKIKLWKESPSAIGVTELTWMDELRRSCFDT